MEIRQFRYFIGIVDAGSFSRAAQVLHIAQPALSQQIAQLEEELGCALLERLRVGVRATHEGEAFYRHAQQILRSIEDTKSAVLCSLARPRGRVSLGLPQSTAQMYAMPLIRCISASYPEIELEIHDEISGNLLSGLLQAKLDIAILVSEDDASLLAATPLMDEELFFVSRSDLSPPSDVLSIAELPKYPLVLPGMAHGVRGLVEQRFQQLNLPPLKPRVVANSINIMRRTVLNGIAYSIMPWAAVTSDVESGVMSARSFSPALSRRIYLCKSKEAALTQAARVVYEKLQALCSEKIKDGSWKNLRLLE